MKGLPIDDTDRRIMQLLRENARMTIAQIGREVSMSQPSVKERIAKLEDKGILGGYAAVLGMSELHRGTTAFVLLNTERCKELADFCLAASEVTDLHRIGGDFNYLITVRTSSIEELTAFQERLVVFGPSKLHVSLKKMLENRVLF
ncbi:Lrp/AsnC family transcriptional regulator [Saccharibacillus sacchari]|uniref:Lrp/AsnC family transcriptional regulator n=1 Tax=Saccharibacillus sacchari TaxID=456493 RepID=A0ACC6PFM9_9BACL